METKGNGRLKKMTEGGTPAASLGFLSSSGNPKNVDGDSSKRRIKGVRRVFQPQANQGSGDGGRRPQFFCCFQFCFEDQKRFNGQRNLSNK
ncbi:hypothetical protein HanPSC8_Chr05g0195311 [Helianthus annuus]|nr:hypothetical protein HanIR_Chr05g0218591 [Helianthus annuus]KAJ0921752.1 hypothetical protein HanPSC8_Chr05g0195311 [Helianthus annuus]